MIRRPLHAQFNGATKDARKVTTIRDKPWPLWQDIMLYNWSGTAYRSKQIDVARVIVESETEILISNVDGIVLFLPDEVDGTPLYRTEGFDSPADLQKWFAKVVKPGQMVSKHLMQFRLL